MYDDGISLYFYIVSCHGHRMRMFDFYLRIISWISVLKFHNYNMCQVICKYDLVSKTPQYVSIVSNWSQYF